MSTSIVPPKEPGQVQLLLAAVIIDGVTDDTSAVNLANVNNSLTPLNLKLNFGIFSVLPNFYSF